MRERITSIRDALAITLMPFRVCFETSIRRDLSLKKQNHSRRDYGVYIAGNGLNNIAGLKEIDAKRFTDNLKVVT